MICYLDIENNSLIKWNIHEAPLTTILLDSRKHAQLVERGQLGDHQRQEESKEQAGE